MDGLRISVSPHVAFNVLYGGRMQDKSTRNKSSSRRRRSTRNRKRSKRRAIFCDTHNCYLESMSPKYWVNNTSAEHQMLNMTVQEDKEEQSEFSILDENFKKKEWMEAFWCPQCQQRNWYHVVETVPRCYNVTLVSDQLCHQFPVLPSAGEHRLLDSSSGGE